MNTRMRWPITFTALGHRPTSLTCPECGQPLIVVSYALSAMTRVLTVGEATSCTACHFALHGGAQ